MTGQEGKSHYILIKGFNPFIYDHTLNRGRKYIVISYCLQAFSAAEILKSRVNQYFEINGKQMIKMPEKGKYVKLKNFKRKIKSPFLI